MHLYMHGSVDLVRRFLSVVSVSLLARNARLTGSWDGMIVAVCAGKVVARSQLGVVGWHDQ